MLNGQGWKRSLKFSWFFSGVPGLLFCEFWLFESPMPRGYNLPYKRFEFEIRLLGLPFLRRVYLACKERQTRETPLGI